MRTRVHIYTDIQIYRYTDIQINRYTDIQIYRYIDIDINAALQGALMKTRICMRNEFYALALEAATRDTRLTCRGGAAERLVIQLPTTPVFWHTFKRNGR
jgi:hypothetical protein